MNLWREEGVSQLVDPMNHSASHIDKVVHKNGVRHTLDNSKKKHIGYGTAIMSRVPAALKPRLSSDEFEIITTELKIAEGITGILCSFYRSPSMTNRNEIISFYNTIVAQIKEVSRTMQSHCSFIVICGDDNSPRTPGTLPFIQIQKVRAELGAIDLIEGFDTRDNRCPDTVSGWYDTSCVDVSATVRGRLTSTCDHSFVIIDINQCIITIC